MSESELIIAARQEEGAAWERLVREHQQAVFRMAYLVLGDADDAEDVAQETFIRALRALDRFDPERPLRPWLLRIATNLARNRHRSASRYLAALRRLVQPGAGPDVGPPDRGVETAVARQRQAETLWQATRRLKGQDREIIYLRFFLDLSVAETAQALEIAPGTVKSRLHRALGRLRGVIVEQFPALGEEFPTFGE